MRTSEEMAESIAAIRDKMNRAAEKAGRNPKEILLCAASKTQSVETVRAAAALDVDVFGENYVQELVEKYDAGAYLGKPVYLIGHLQTNKVKMVVGRASMIQSVDSLHLLQAIEKEAAKKDLIQDILIEINAAGEESKTGITPEEVFSLADAAETSPHIRLRGLMTIPPVNDDDTENRRILGGMYALYLQLKSRGYTTAQIDTLSMGMSGDYENAILEGSTMVRIGTAVFGARYYPPKQ